LILLHIVMILYHKTTAESEILLITCSLSQILLITCVIPEEFEAESFPLKYNHTTSECKAHSVEIDLHYFK